MSRRLSVQLKCNKNATKAPKPKVKFPDDLIFLDCVKENDVENVKAMLRRASANIDINKMNDSGLTPMHQACLENSFEVVKLLLENGANINSLDEEEWTPLHAAVSMGYYDIVDYLIKNGADVDALTIENERPIDLADQDEFPIISLLLNHMKINDEENLEDEEADDTLSNNVSNRNSNDKSNHEIDGKESETIHGKPPMLKKKKSRFSIV